ncbi:MAG: hypothetical protein J5J00_00340 [Deltaproteobacteria bacterium]|nr:hypothetical protein [Deltaproteobacteria bacterium]
MRLLRISGALLLLSFAAVSGCGGGTNNDQGLALTLLGYRADSDNCSEAVPNQTGTTEPFSTTDESSGATFAGGIVAGLVVENNLSHQHVILQNAFFEYYVPGATAQPPATSSPLGFVVGKKPISEGGEEEEGGTDPGSGVTSEPIVCGETFVVPAEVRTWMLLNRQSLPEPPFTMEVRGFVTGITSAGDRFDTNEVNYLVQFTPDIIINGGTSGSTGGTDGGTDGGTGDDGGAGTDDGTGDTGGDSTGSEGAGTDDSADL